MVVYNRRSGGRRVAMRYAEGTGTRWGRRVGGFVGGIAKSYKRHKRSASSMSKSSKTALAVRRRAAANFLPASDAPIQFTNFYKSRARGTKLGKLWKQLMPVRSARHTDMFSVSSAQGEQATAFVPWFIQGHLDNPFDILDDTNIPTVKGYFKFLKGEIRMTNQINANMQICIYDVVPRRDMDTSQPNPAAAWDTGLSATNGVSHTVKGYNNLGVTPYESPLFVSLYKIVKVTKMVLSAGQGHVHKVNLKQNVVMQKYQKDQYVYYRNLSAITIITVNGMPVCSDANDLNIAVSKTDLACVSTRHIEYRGINGQPAYYQYHNNQASFVDPIVMTHNTGGPNAVTQA